MTQLETGIVENRCESSREIGSRRPIEGWRGQDVDDLRDDRLAGEDVDLTTLGSLDELATLLDLAIGITDQKPHETVGVDKGGHMNFSA